MPPLPKTLYTKTIADNKMPVLEIIKWVNVRTMEYTYKLALVYILDLEISATTPNAIRILLDGNPDAKPIFL